jgi:hypothetical protein
MKASTKSNTSSVFWILSFFLLLFYPCTIYAFPETVNYQGMLVQKEDGKKLDCTLDMIFTIYDVETGGTPLWTEEHFAVPINNGYFEVKLGSQEGGDISLLPSDSDLYLVVSIGGETMNARIKLDSVIHAMFSKYALEAKTVALNSISPEHIQNQSISSEKIADNAVTTSKIKDGAITNPKIAQKSISADKINDGQDSNLDADLLDGKDSTEFVLKSESESLNKGTTIQLIAGESILGAETPVPVYIRKDGLIFEQSENNASSAAFGVNRFAQTFQTDVSTTKVKSVSLYLEKLGSPTGIIDVSFCELQENNIPKALSSQNTQNASDISNGWNEFIFSSPVSVNPLTSYAIMISVPGGDASNHVKWKYAASNVYDSGVFLSDSDYGAVWNSVNDRDFAFKLYSDGRVYKCSASDLNTLDFVGFAVSNADVGETIKIQTNGIVSGFSGLNVGEKYYVQDEPGVIGAMVGSYRKLVAVAVNDGELTIFWSDSVNIATEAEAIVGMNNKTIMTPFSTQQVLLANKPKYYLDSGEYYNLSSNENTQWSKDIKIGFKPTYFKAYLYLRIYVSGNKYESFYTSIIEGISNGKLLSVYNRCSKCFSYKGSPFSLEYYNLSGDQYSDSSYSCSSLSSPNISVVSYNKRFSLNSIEINSDGLKFNFSYTTDNSSSQVGMHYAIKNITAWE